MDSSADTNCHTCGSPSPRLHPSVQPDGGEVYEICGDSFHSGVELFTKAGTLLTPGVEAALSTEAEAGYDLSKAARITMSPCIHSDLLTVTQDTGRRICYDCGKDVCRTCLRTKEDNWTMCSNGFHYKPTVTLWVLTKNCEHEVEEILGIYSSRENAEGAWERCKAKFDSCGRGDIEGFVLDEEVFGDDGDVD